MIWSIANSTDMQLFDTCHSLLNKLDSSKETSNSASLPCQLYMDSEVQDSTKNFPFTNIYTVPSISAADLLENIKSFGSAWSKFHVQKLWLVDFCFYIFVVTSTTDHWSVVCWCNYDWRQYNETRKSSVGFWGSGYTCTYVITDQIGPHSLLSPF